MNHWLRFAIAFPCCVVFVFILRLVATCILDAVTDRRRKE